MQSNKNFSCFGNILRTDFYWSSDLPKSDFEKLRFLQITMIMKKIVLPLILSLLINSCNLSEKFNQVQKINDDLEQHFGHDNISVSIGFGTDDEDNYVEVTFYEYGVSSIDYMVLKDISHKVSDRLKSKLPNLKSKQLIEVRFTEETKSDTNNSFVTFKNRIKTKD